MWLPIQTSFFFINVFVVVKERNFFFSADLNDVTLDKTKVYVLFNDPLEITCDPPEARPAASVTWLKAAGEDLPKRFDIKGCCTLRNNRTKLNDAGSYTCTAKNMAGNKSETVEITVVGEYLLALAVMWYMFTMCGYPLCTIVCLKWNLDYGLFVGRLFS